MESKVLFGNTKLEMLKHPGGDIKKTANTNLRSTF